MVENHSYEKPAKGETEWHIPLNGNFDALDTDVEVRDLDENRGSYTPKDGAKFLATDTERVYVGDGESWNALASRGRRSSFESVEADGVFSTSDDRAGCLVTDNGEYRGFSFVTGESFGPSSDAGVVLQELVDSLSEAAGSGERLGEIVIGQGQFDFSTSVVLNNHAGLGIVGQSRKQTNKFSSTIFRNDGIDTGRGILEFGNIGATSNTGNAQGSYVERIFFDGGFGDIIPIYVWSQDRIRLTDVKVDNMGALGHGICYIGSFNTTWRSVYAKQAAFLENVALGKDNNSFRAIDCTFNSDNSSVPPAIFHGAGCRHQLSLFNSLDVTDGLDAGLFVLMGDETAAVVQDSDSRVSESDLNANLTRTHFYNCGFVGDRGGDDGLVDSPTKVTFDGCEFTNASHAIRNGAQLVVSGSRFTDQTAQSIWWDSSTSKPNITITGNRFFECGTSGTPVIGNNGHGQNIDAVISGNTFKGTGGTYDIGFGDKTTNYVVVGNRTEKGVAPYNGGPLGDMGRSRAPLVVNNLGHNPVGFDRETPSAPTGTGQSNSVTNNNNQGAWVYQEGGSGVAVRAFGTTTELNTDPSTVFVPRHGEIYFNSSEPSAWDWWWV